MVAAPKAGVVHEHLEAAARGVLDDNQVLVDEVDELSLLLALHASDAE
jgi:hypothetical protein